MKSTNILHNMAENTLAGLSDADKRRVLKLMARAAENAYRRGFQQGATIATQRPQDLPPDLHAWRYGATLDVSPWADSRNRERSVARLLSEAPQLRRARLVP